MTRHDLGLHIRVRCQELAAELTDVLWARMERQIDDALEVARSALEADMEAPEAKPEPVKAGGEIVPVILIGTSKVDANHGLKVIERDVKPVNVPKPEPAFDELIAAGKAKRTIRCSKCGAVGKRAPDCGIGHNLPIAPAPIPFVPVAAPRADRPDRTASIAAAKARIEERRLRQEARDGDERRRPLTVDDEESNGLDEPDTAASIGLPTPRATFNL